MSIHRQSWHIRLLIADKGIDTHNEPLLGCYFSLKARRLGELPLKEPVSSAGS